MQSPDHPAAPVDSGRTPNPGNYRIRGFSAADRVFRADETGWAAAGHTQECERRWQAISETVVATAEGTVAPCLPVETACYEGREVWERTQLMVNKSQSK